MEQRGDAEKRSIWARAPVLGGPLVLLGVVLAVAWRITRGLDLGDESYYAIFIYDWLKGGVASSTLLTLHQTAALIVYPAARIYSALIDGDRGLFLFLRSLFLLGNLAAGLCWLKFLEKAGFRALGWFVAAAATAFIPFGLPAPSYNTVGLQGLEIGLAAFGAAQVAANRSALVWSLISACGWAMATVAYPTLGGVLGVFLLANVLAMPKAGRARYIALVVGAQAAAWGGVLGVLGWHKLHDSYSYLAQANAVTDWSRKAQFAADLFDRHPTFACETIFALAFGVFGRPLGALAVSLALGAMCLATLILKPALFIPSHDLMFLLALSGLHLLGGLKRGATERDRLVAVLYLTALSAAGATTLTAYNSLFNFAVGGAAAALLALLGPSSEHSAGRLALAARATVACGVLTFISLTHFYGDRPGEMRPRQHVDSGVFAGLWVQPAQAATLKRVHDEAAPLMDKKGATIAEVGIAPGLIMETGARPLMLSVYPLAPTVPPAVMGVTVRFHQAHPADWVLIYRDIYFDPPNPFGGGFSSQYRLVSSEVEPLGVVTLFRRVAPGQGP